MDSDSLGAVVPKSAAAQRGGATVVVPDAATLLKFKSRQAITRVFAAFLTILEEVTDDHDAAMDKLTEALPEEFRSYPQLADHLTDTRLDALRRRVLKIGNDEIRGLEEQIDCVVK